MIDNEQIINEFKFSTPIHMRWNDLDPLGHVNNIYYFEYFQIARGLYMPTVSQTWKWDKNMFVIAHIECDYYKELTLNHRSATVKIRTSKLSTKSFEMEYLICSLTKEGKEQIHAKGKSVNVMVDPIAKKSIEIPDWLREDINNFELKI